MSNLKIRSDFANGEVEAVAQTIAGLTKKPANGVIVTDDTAYEATLPEGLTLDTVQQVDKHNAVFAAGQALVAGELAATAFEGDKALERVESSIKTGGMTFKATVHRTKSFGTGDKEVTKNLHVDAAVTMKGIGGRGQYKKVRTSLAELGAELFGK